MNPSSGAEQEDVLAATWTAMPIQSFDMIYAKPVTAAPAGQSYTSTLDDGIGVSMLSRSLPRRDRATPPPLTMVSG